MTDEGISPTVFEHLWDLTATVLDAHGIDPRRVEDLVAWLDVVLGPLHGMIAIVEYETKTIAVVNAPLLAHSETGGQRSLADILFLAPDVAWLPTASYALNNLGLYLTACTPVDAGASRDKALDDIYKLAGVISALRGQIERRMQGKIRKARSLRKPNTALRLPEIKKTPSEFESMHALLARLDEHSRDVFIDLMERWEHGGFFVETTPYAVLLEIPFCERRVRLASLAPLYQGEGSGEIVLGWDGLRRQKGFPNAAFDHYQNTVRRLAELHHTGNSAHLVVDERFELQRARQLARAMQKLGASVQHELVEAIPPLRLSTPENILQTLQACSSHTRAVFNLLAAGWQQAGGVVQCPRPGRICLKLKTHPHLMGTQASPAHKVYLAVLCAPHGKHSAAIQITWGLAGGGKFSYLDAIPLDVQAFESAAAALPRFEQQGSTTRLVVDEYFTIDCAEALLAAMMQLKETEETAG